MARSSDRRWLVTLTVVLVVVLVALIGVAGLRLAQMRSAPLGVPRIYPDSGAGGTTFEISSDVMGYASAPAVEGVLTRHFDAINQHNYAAWTSTMTPAAVAEQTQVLWTKFYAHPNTVVGTIRLARIDEVGPGRVVALVSYLTSQKPEDAPGGLNLAQVCWRVSYWMTGAQPKIDVGGPGSVTRGKCHDN